MKKYLETFLENLGFFSALALGFFIMYWGFRFIAFIIQLILK